MTLVQGEDVGHVVSTGEDDDGRVGDAKREIWIAVEDVNGFRDISRTEGFELICARCDLFKEGSLDPGRHAGRQKVVEFGEHEG